MRIGFTVFRANPFPCVARAARIRGVTGRAKPRIGASFVAMPSGKTCSVYAEAHGIIKKHLLGENCSRHSMTSQTRSFGMTIHAKLPLGSSPHTMFAHEVPRMNEMIVGTNSFVAQIHMTRIATIIFGQLIGMKVTTSAGGHAWT